MTVTTVDTMLDAPVDVFSGEKVTASVFTIARMRNGEMPMFLTAYEIMQMFQPLDGDREDSIIDYCDCDDEDSFGYCSCDYDMDCEDDETLWKRKYEEIMCTPTGEDILANGVRNPVSLQWNPDETGDSGLPEVLGGHHRTALMYYQKPHTLMPVAFFVNCHQAGTYLKDAY